MRVKSVQIFDAMYFERENQRKCHKRNWARMGCFIFGISYDTYLSYLKMDTSDISPIPSRAIAELQKMSDKLLLHERTGRRTRSSCEPMNRCEESRNKD